MHIDRVEMDLETVRERLERDAWLFPDQQSTAYRAGVRDTVDAVQRMLGFARTISDRRGAQPDWLIRPSGDGDRDADAPLIVTLDGDGQPAAARPRR